MLHEPLEESKQICHPAPVKSMTRFFVCSGTTLAVGLWCKYPLRNIRLQRCQFYDFAINNTVLHKMLGTQRENVLMNRS